VACDRGQGFLITEQLRKEHYHYSKPLKEQRREKSPKEQLGERGRNSTTEKRALLSCMKRLGGKETNHVEEKNKDAFSRFTLFIRAKGTWRKRKRKGAGHLSCYL